MRWKIFRVEDGSFVGSDNRTVNGVYIYLVPVLAYEGGDSRQPIRIFMHADTLANMGYTPTGGDEVYLFRNEATGKIVSILKA